MSVSVCIPDSPRLRSTPSSFEMPAGLYRRHFSPDNYLSGETEDIRFAGGADAVRTEKLPGSYILELVDVPERTFHLLRSAQRANRCARSHRRALSDAVVGWRTVSLRRTMLGPDRSPRAARLRGQGRHPADSRRPGARRQFQLRAAISFWRDDRRVVLLITRPYRPVPATHRKDSLTRSGGIKCPPENPLYSTL